MTAAARLILHGPDLEIDIPEYSCDPGESTACEGCSRIVRQTLFHGGVAFWLCSDCFAAVNDLAGEPPTPAHSPAGAAPFPIAGPTACTTDTGVPMAPAGEILW